MYEGHPTKGGIDMDTVQGSGDFLFVLLPLLTMILPLLLTISSLCYNFCRSYV